MTMSAAIIQQVRSAVAFWVAGSAGCAAAADWLLGALGGRAGGWGCRALGGIARLPASTTAFLGLLSPVVAILLGWVVAGEHFTPMQMLGTVIVLGAISAAILTRTPARSDANEWLANERTP